MKFVISSLCGVCHRRRREGIVLVETMVALTLFGFFMAAASTLVVQHRRLSDMARNHYTAVNIAKNRLELVRTFDFNQVENFVEVDVIVDKGGFPDTEGRYRRSTVVKSIEDNLIQLEVVVEILNRKTLQFDGEREMLSSYFAQYLSEDSSVGAGVTPNG